MVKFSFVLCAEPYKYEAIDTLINLGQAIVHKGHQILGIFLYGSGVHVIKERTMKGNSIRNIPERLETFCKKYNVTLTACSTWISFTGIQKSEFIQGACQEGLGGLSHLISISDKVIFFGPGG
ncbi:MAG: DsrE/DsrF/TusD sulfur relay family protein [Promethearchaeota archaeon]